MKFTSVLFACLGLSAVSWAPLAAQPSSELPVQFAVRSSVWTVTAGLRARSAGADVKFGKLGVVSPIRTLAPIDEVVTARNYDDAYMNVDVPRAIEKDADGNVLTTPGGRYQTYALDDEGNPFVTGDFLSYTPGLTRQWGYARDSQVTEDGRIAMNAYSASSEGATAEAEGGAVGGAELGLARLMGQITPRVSWGLGGTIAVTDINNKASGHIVSTLHTVTDYYSLNGQTAPSAPYNGPSFINLVDAEGNLIAVNSLETTVPISDTPESRTETSTPGGAVVDGFWQIKGAYYLMRVGPHVRAHLGNNFAVFASAGVTGAFIGTKYRASEFLVTDLEGANIGGFGQSEEDRFMSGFYAEVLGEYWISPRTGLYAGATYESLGEFDQTLGGRTATIDMGKGVGFRLGVITRF